MTQQEPQIDALSTPVVKVTKKELPLCCPRAGDTTTGLHPRVFIPLKQIGDEASCRYCRTLYRVVE
ncbi:zinc-finger domain-containing protein [Sedimenticola sp.]|uniref:zinc-finger domain-containing protein n=1 Tax=Sedimenticola sp. TaxID=1940285 RepID=UPI003D1014A8